MGHEQYTCADCGRSPSAKCVNSKWLAECPECGPADEPHLWTGGETMADAVEHWSALQNPMRFARVELLREMQEYGWVADEADWQGNWEGGVPTARQFAHHYMTLPCLDSHIVDRSHPDDDDDFNARAIEKLRSRAEDDPVEYAYGVVAGYHDDTFGNAVHGIDEGVTQVLGHLETIHRLDIERIAKLNNLRVELEAQVVELTKAAKRESSAAFQRGYREAMASRDRIDATALGRVAS